MAQSGKEANAIKAKKEYSILEAAMPIQGDARKGSGPADARRARKVGIYCGASRRGPAERERCGIRSGCREAETRLAESYSEYPGAPCSRILRVRDVGTYTITLGAIWGREKVLTVASHDILLKLMTGGQKEADPVDKVSQLKEKLAVKAAETAEL